MKRKGHTSKERNVSNIDEKRSIQHELIYKRSFSSVGANKHSRARFQNKPIKNQIADSQQRELTERQISELSLRNIEFFTQ